MQYAPRNRDSPPRRGPELPANVSRFLDDDSRGHSVPVRFDANSGKASGLQGEYEHFINNRDSGSVVIEGPEPSIGECSTATGAKDADHVDLPPVRSRLWEIEHMEDVPEAVVLSLLEDFFSESSAAGMARSLDKLEESTSSGLHGEQLHDLVHRMIGDCKCAGAVAVAAQLEEFERSPTVGAVTDMRITIGRTKQEAQKRYPELRC